METGLTMPKITITKCIICQGTGKVADKLWGVKKCPAWNCKNGLVEREEKTPEELDKEFKEEQDGLNGECKL
jgi:hypothetical protein